MDSQTVIKITDYIETDLEWEKEQCRALHVDLTACQMKSAGPDELIEACRDADILVVNMARFSPEVIRGLDHAKVIIRHGIGYENLDVGTATEEGIICANEPTASSEDVAEQAIMLILAVYRKVRTQISLFNQLVDKGTNLSGKDMMDTMHPVYRMGGKTLGIIGCGHIGSHVLKKMSGFGMTVLVCDPYLPEERKKELGIEHTPLDDLLQQSDIVTVHVPVTEETTGMINADIFKQMKSSAVLVNTARAKIINTEDLAHALRSGSIAGAGIDVHSTEPPPKDYPLLGLDNVLLTPHLAWYSEEGGWDIREMIMDDIRSVLAGGLPANVLNPEVFKRPNLRFRYNKQ